MSDKDSAQPRDYGRRSEDKPIYTKWEFYVALANLAIATAMIQDGLIPPEGRWHAVVSWLGTLTGQICIIFGRPLLTGTLQKTLKNGTPPPENGA